MGKKVKVKNRLYSIVFYDIPELNVKRTFSGGEEKMIDIDEIKALQYLDGGDVLLKNYLYIEDEEALNELQLGLSDLYSLTRDDIEKILVEGSLEDLRYFLKKAPKGSIELMKEIGVEKRFADKEKNNLIMELTNYNIMSAVGVNDQIEAYNEAHNIKTKTENQEENSVPKGIASLLKGKKTTQTKNKINETEDFEVVE